ncbi:MAG: hypothetical protein LQ350_005165 [Teloschistes chrysophthalmus]|nr:MAG: hypothetical protein LQ350_005165 [Niorma chrysophthalma]
MSLFRRHRKVLPPQDDKISKEPSIHRTPSEEKLKEEEENGKLAESLKRREERNADFCSRHGIDPNDLSSTMQNGEKEENLTKEELEVKRMVCRSWIDAEAAQEYRDRCEDAQLDSLRKQRARQEEDARRSHRLFGSGMMACIGG